eukprot:Sdes_comp17022_c0_seq1m6221
MKSGTDQTSLESPEYRLGIIGVKGLRALVRKTVDELNSYIWVHCKIIVPSLLNSMKGDVNENYLSEDPDNISALDMTRTLSQSFTNIHNTTTESLADNEEHLARKLSQSALKNLVLKSNFQNISIVLAPIFT